MDVNSFLTLGPGVEFIKLFCVVTDDRTNKLERSTTTESITAVND
jgi:hypothetical protein